MNKRIEVLGLTALAAVAVHLWPEAGRAQAQYMDGPGALFMDETALKDGGVTAFGDFKKILHRGDYTPKVRVGQTVPPQGDTPSAPWRAQRGKSPPTTARCSSTSGKA